MRAKKEKESMPMATETNPVEMTDKLVEFLLPTEGEIKVGHISLGEMFPLFKQLWSNHRRATVP